MIQLVVNSLIRYKENKQLERIVWIAEDKSLCFAIEMDKNSFPVPRYMDELLLGLKSFLIELVEEDDWDNYIHEESLSDKEKQIRDQAWNVISKIAIGKNEPFIFYPKERRKLINKATVETGVSVSSIERHLKKFWRLGKTKSALLPSLRNCGAKGREKPETTNKRGRPSKYGNKGVNVTKEMKDIFRIAMDRYYYKKNKASLQLTYELMVKDFFLKGDNLDNSTELSIPSFRQFYYWIQKERSISKEISTRQSTKEYLLNYRPLLGNTSMETGTIGTFQIDATIADVFLTSKWDRNKIIGRPIVYYCVDTFSHYITSFYVGLEGPSWLGAMMCLLNTIEDKVETCKKYGIEISKEEWNVSHLPFALLADRGELLSKSAENLVESLGIRIQNTGKFRGDLKAQVEQQFRMTNLFVKPLLPGAIDSDFQKRGSQDYRLNSRLNIYEFTQVVLRIILYYNNNRTINNFNRDEMLIHDSVPAIPVHLWNWAMENRAGGLKKLPLEIVRLNLLPRERAVVTRHGIRFRGMYYSCQKAIEEKWFMQARSKRGNWKVDISYDPRNVGYIYLRDSNGRDFEICRLLEHQSHYDNMRIEEIESLLSTQKQQIKDHGTEELIAKVELLDEIQKIVKSASKEAKIEKVEQSKASKIKGIRLNRQTEKEMLRAEQVVELSENKAPIGKDKSEEAQDYYYDVGLIRSVVKGETL